jgi:hypothetical protein
MTCSGRNTGSILVILTLVLLLSCTVGFAQESYNETRGPGIHAGLFYWSVTNEILFEPGLQYKYRNNLFRFSNEFLIYEGRVMESALALNYRRYPFRNARRARFFCSGELRYIHTEGYYERTRHLNAYFLLLGGGMEYGITDRFNIGLEAGWGPGVAYNSRRFDNNKLIFKKDFAIVLSYNLDR